MFDSFEITGRGLRAGLPRDIDLHPANMSPARRAEEKVICKNDIRFGDYDVNFTCAILRQESRAIREIAVRFAQSLVANLIEGF